MDFCLALCSHVKGTNRDRLLTRATVQYAVKYAGLQTEWQNLPEAKAVITRQKQCFSLRWKVNILNCLAARLTVVHNLPQ